MRVPIVAVRLDRRNVGIEAQPREVVQHFQLHTPVDSACGRDPPLVGRPSLRRRARFPRQKWHSPRDRGASIPSAQAQTGYANLARVARAPTAHTTRCAWRPRCHVQRMLRAVKRETPRYTSAQRTICQELATATWPARPFVCPIGACTLELGGVGDACRAPTRGRDSTIAPSDVTGVASPSNSAMVVVSIA